MPYGFIGAGEITAAIVEGLSAEVPDPPAVFLSPRGREVAQGLAARYPNVQVCDSNQDVLDRATHVVLAVRVPIARAVLEELEFEPRHVLVSAVAGVSLADLREWAAPVERVVRSIPLPPAAHRQSRTVMYPDDDVARELYERVGDVLVSPDEDVMASFQVATATFAAHLDYLATIADWLADHGVDHAAATGYVSHIFGQVGQSLLNHPDELTALRDRHTTPGGLNEQVLTALRDAGLPAATRQALEAVHTRVTT